MIFLIPVDIKMDSVEETFKNCLRMEAEDDDGGDTRRIQLLSSPPDISLSSMAMSNYSDSENVEKILNMSSAMFTLGFTVDRKAVLHFY